MGGLVDEPMSCWLRSLCVGGCRAYVVEIIRIKAILVQSIEIGLTGSELGKIKVKEIMTIHIILFSHSRKLQLQS